MTRDAVTLSEPKGKREAARPGGDPARVGRFAIRRRLGEGGMGVVLVGRDDTLERDVALKLVRPGRGSAGAQARMLREAQAMARVSHPNVVPIYEAGLHEDDLYIAMELVQGCSLADWLSAERRPVRALLEKFAQAGRGLGAAHRAGILHRDFKPANVLVGDDGRARVVDFGLARAALERELEDEEQERIEGADTHGETVRVGHALLAELTQQGVILGTPAYMSPEHFRGEATEASDQWSFAVSLYRALWGAAPFEGDGVLALMEAVVKGPAPAPPPNADVPPAIAAAVLRALERDPAARFPTIDAMVDVIDAELGIDPDNDPARSRRQRRGLAVLVLVAAVASLLGLGVRTGWSFQIGLEGVLLQGVIALLTITLATVVFRRTLLRDAHGRRVTLFFFLFIGAMVAHRLVSLEAMTPVPVVLRGDAAFGIALALLAGMTLERWIVWTAAVLAGYLALSYAFPAACVPGFGLAMMALLALAIGFWREPQPRAFLAGDSRSGSGRRTPSRR